MGADPEVIDFFGKFDLVAVPSLAHLAETLPAIEI
jgi:hypothetical protein